MNYLEALEKIESYKHLIGKSITNQKDQTSCVIKKVTAIKSDYEVSGNFKNINDPDYIRTIMSEDLIIVFIAGSSYTGDDSTLVPESLYLSMYL